jgi:hypothetical protein
VAGRPPLSIASEERRYVALLDPGDLVLLANDVAEVDGLEVGQTFARGDQRFDCRGRSAAFVHTVPWPYDKARNQVCSPGIQKRGQLVGPARFLLLGFFPGDAQSIDRAAGIGQQLPRFPVHHREPREARGVGVECGAFVVHRGCSSPIAAESRLLLLTQ